VIFFGLRIKYNRTNKVKRASILAKKSNFLP
jgi:hypothetical protein